MVTDGRVMVRVFLPHRLLATQSGGDLIGWYEDRDGVITVFVFGVRSWGTTPTGERSDRIGVVGVCVRDDDQGGGRRYARDPSWSPGRRWPFIGIRLTVDDRLEVTEARVGNERVRFPSGDCLLVLYDPGHYTALDPEVLGDRAPEQLLAALSRAMDDFRRVPAAVRGEVECELGQNDSGTWREELSRRLVQAVSFSADVLCGVLNVRATEVFVDKLSRFSHVGSQIKTRLLQLEDMRNDEARTNRKLRYWNTFAAIVFDVAMGLILMTIWHRCISTMLLVEFFLEWTNHLVTQLRSLLLWMMGVPAGFKLNSPLSLAMGTFFSYHIYLWEAYLFVIKPVLKVMLDASSYGGVFGITFQMCLLKDFLALATFHVYCFYAYAARIYNINFVGLVSYWRLFRGKKWNPLRKRVDSCTYDADQLFMGTLCFTTLLFLLPTTLLYYIVFTTLRIPILVLQGLVHQMVVLIDGLPLYTLILRSMNSKALVDNVYFEVRTHQCVSFLGLSMRGTCCSWLVAATAFRPPLGSIGDSLPWKTFAKNILTGKLIYPI